MSPLHVLLKLVVSYRKAQHPVSSPVDLHDVPIHVNLSPMGLYVISNRFPHHPGTQLRVIKLLDERLDVLLPAPKNGIHDRGAQRQPFDALRRPFRLYLVARYPPDLFRVGLEKSPIQALPEAVADPLLKILLLRIGKEERTEKAHHDKKAVPQAQAPYDIAQFERVMEELPVIVDPGKPGNTHELRSQHLVPDLDHLRDLGEESMPPDVEPIALENVGTRVTAYDVLLFENNGHSPALAQLVGRRQPRRPGARYQHLPGFARILRALWVAACVGRLGHGC